jgi:hypothetical protein
MRRSAARNLIGIGKIFPIQIQQKPAEIGAIALHAISSFVGTFFLSDNSEKGIDFTSLWAISSPRLLACQIPTPWIVFLFLFPGTAYL